MLEYSRAKELHGLLGINKLIDVLVGIKLFINQLDFIAMRIEWIIVRRFPT